MPMSIRLFVPLLVAAVLMGCGSDDKKTPPVGQTCVLNSECNNPLSCSFGKCHAPCQESRDCNLGQRCVKSETGVNVCQLPEEQTCAFNSMCKTPLVCARDLQCRNQCMEDRDCSKGQRCLKPDLVCADMADLDPATGMLRMPDAGAGGGTDGGAGDGPVVTADAAGGGSDAGPGGTTPDAPAPSGDGPRVVPDAEVPVEGITAMPATVRQGEGNVIITVTGRNLANPADLQLGDLKVTLEPGATDTMFKLGVTVPHGAMIGPKTLTFTTAGGHGRKENVLTVSAITAGPMGNDSNRGSADNPFRTFKRALQVATAGDTVQLLDGTYRQADGETWMVPIPDKVTVLGQSAANTQLIGPGESGGAVNVDGLTFAGDATVKNLSVSAFQYDIRLTKPATNVALESVRATGARYYALYVDFQAKGATVTISGKENAFDRSAQTAIYVYAPEVTLKGTGEGTIGSLASGYGLQIAGAKATVDLNGFTFTEAMIRSAVYSTSADANIKFEKVSFQDYLYVGGAMTSLELIGCTVKVPDNASYAVDFAGQKLAIRDSTIEGSRYGVRQNNGMSEATIRGSTFKGYGNYGYYLTAGKLDLGTAMERGNNQFMGPDNAYGLYDSRQSATLPITSSNTTFNGFRPPAGKIMGRVMEPGRYYIYTVGNVIEFFEL